MSLNNCLTTKFLASVLTVKDRLWRRFLRLYCQEAAVLSRPTWCPLVSRLLKRLSSLLSASCVVVASSARYSPSRTPRRINASTRCLSAAVFFSVANELASHEILASFVTCWMTFRHCFSAHIQWRTIWTSGQKYDCTAPFVDPVSFEELIRIAPCIYIFWRFCRVKVVINSVRIRHMARWSSAPTYYKSYKLAALRLGRVNLRCRTRHCRSISRWPPAGCCRAGFRPPVSVVGGVSYRYSAKVTMQGTRVTWR